MSSTRRSCWRCETVERRLECRENERPPHPPLRVGMTSRAQSALLGRAGRQQPEGGRVQHPACSVASVPEAAAIVEPVSRSVGGSARLGSAPVHERNAASLRAGIRRDAAQERPTNGRQCHDGGQPMTGQWSDTASVASSRKLGARLPGSLHTLLQYHFRAPASCHARHPSWDSDPSPRSPARKAAVPAAMSPPSSQARDLDFIPPTTRTVGGIAGFAIPPGKPIRRLGLLLRLASAVGSSAGGLIPLPSPTCAGQCRACTTRGVPACAPAAPQAHRRP